jgi:hypothetical protein
MAALGPRSMEALQLVARESVLYGTVALPPGLLQRRWRQDLDLALAFAQADAVLAAKGALQLLGPNVPPEVKVVFVVPEESMDDWNCVLHIVC